jgi:hypothetical protein
MHRNSEFNLACAKTNQEIRVDPSIVDAIRLSNLRYRVHRYFERQTMKHFEELNT